MIKRLIIAGVALGAFQCGAFAEVKTEEVTY